MSKTAKSSLSRMKRADETAGEAPNVESMRWLKMMFHAIGVGQAEGLIPRFGDGTFIMRSRVMASLHRTENGKNVVIPESGWESTGKVYVEVVLNDGSNRIWSYPVGAINGRDLRYVVGKIHEQSDLGIAIMNHRIVRAITAVS